VSLIGDLNTTMWSPYYKNYIGNTQLKNTRYGFGILPTWKIIHQFFAIPIDHSLVTPDIKINNVYTGRSIGSDRLPLITNLQLSSRYYLKLTGARSLISSTPVKWNSDRPATSPLRISYWQV
jgi:hypothetical protein